MAMKPVRRRTVLGGMTAAAMAAALPTTAGTSAASGAVEKRPAAGVEPQADNEVWRLGNVDSGAGSSGEFRDYLSANPEQVEVPSNWGSRTDWSGVLSKGLKANVNPAMVIQYHLDSKPAFGARLQVKIIKAHRSIPQMAVFSNGTMVGMIQIAGLDGSGTDRHYRRTYRLYIPREFLEAGTNFLRLEAVKSYSGSNAENDKCYWEWDHLRMYVLGAAATEPVHGRRFHLGTTVMRGGFNYDADVVRHLPPVLEWLGIAYSGNVMRAGFWSDTTSRWSGSAQAYLDKMAEFNMRVVADHLNSRLHAPLNADGTLGQDGRDRLDSFFNTYGSHFQYYEVDNEPGNYGSTKASNVAIARYVRNAATRPSHVQVVSPGWSYRNWALNDGNRREVEAFCHLTSGHAYGPSYAQIDPNTGGGASFVENIDTHAPITDGLPKEMLVTETGTTNGHTDNPNWGASQPKAAAFDRILRAHVGYADHVMQHAAFFSTPTTGYQLFQNTFDWTTHNPLSTTAYSFGSGQQTRVDIFRRIACAYATHGAPLTYSYRNREALKGHKVYTRVVNTATLARLPGSGGKADKVLINVVNFDNTQQTVRLRVTLPDSGAWSGKRVRGGNVCRDAQTAVSVTGPTVDLEDLILAPGEAVQYILARA